MNRRKFIRKGFYSLAGIGLLTGIYSWQIEPTWVEIVHQKMPIANLPNELVGKTLMQISDIHIGDRFNYQHIIKAFNDVRHLRPDYVAYTGDFVTLSNRNVRYDKLQEVIGKMVYGQSGTVAILGNHDYGLNFKDAMVAEKITNMLKTSHITTLRNECKDISGLTFIGIDDYWGTNFYPHKVMDTITSRQPSVVLCHNPDVCDLDVWNNYNGWILSGHTHGGQVKAPFLPPFVVPVTNKRYTAGYFQLSNERHLYINRGLGCLWPIRFNVRPEITIFTLEKSGVA